MKYQFGGVELETVIILRTNLCLHEVIKTYKSIYLVINLMKSRNTKTLLDCHKWADKLKEIIGRFVDN